MVNILTPRLLFCVLVCAAVNTQTYGQMANSWVKRNNISSSTSTDRHTATVFTIGTKAYVGTGVDASGSIKKNDFWEYDTETDTWTQKADFPPGARNNAVAFSIGNKGYVGTGHDQTYRKDFWEYDPATNAWTRKADFPGTARRTAVGFNIGNKGYIGTGEDGPLPSGANNYLKDFWEYDPSTNTWTQKADFGGTPRAQAVGFSIGTKGYIGTGYDTYGTATGRKDFWEYDPTTNTWTQKADAGISGRFAGIGFSAGSKGYVGTGINSSHLKDFWEYDPTANAWTQKADFAQGRSSAVGFGIGNQGYISTGYSSGATNDMWVYNRDGGLQTLTVSGSAFCAGGAIDVHFDIGMLELGTGNIFTAQLSDVAGAFSAPVTIGTLQSASAGTIHATLPLNAPTGGGYRIRVVSSSPVVSGSDNGSNLTLNATPDIPITTSASRCDDGTVYLTATATTGVMTWYDMATGGAQIFVGTEFETPSISSSTTYYVESDFNGCKSPERASATATVNRTPSIMETVPGVRCAEGTVSLAATASDGAITWYDVETGGNSLFTGTPFTTAIITESKTYYVAATAEGCTSARTAVTATVIPKPAKPEISIDPSDPLAPVLSSSEGTSYHWFKDGEPIQVTTRSFTAEISGIYTVSINGGDCVSDQSDPVAAIITSTAPEIANPMNLYPNPARGHVTILLAGFSTDHPVSISIFDGKGSLVERTIVKGLDEVSIDVASYPSGRFLVRMTQNRSLQKQHFIKQ